MVIHYGKGKVIAIILLGKSTVFSNGILRHEKAVNICAHKAQYLLLGPLLIHQYPPLTISCQRPIGSRFNRTPRGMDTGLARTVGKRRWCVHKGVYEYCIFSHRFPKENQKTSRHFDDHFNDPLYGHFAGHFISHIHGSAVQWWDGCASFKTSDHYMDIES